MVVDYEEEEIYDQEWNLTGEHLAALLDMRKIHLGKSSPNMKLNEMFVRKLCFWPTKEERKRYKAQLISDLRREERARVVDWTSHLGLNRIEA